MSAAGLAGVDGGTVALRYVLRVARSRGGGGGICHASMGGGAVAGGGGGQGGHG